MHNCSILLYNRKSIWALFFLLLAFAPFVYSQQQLIREIDTEVKATMKKGHIPGLSLVIIDNNRHMIRTYGYADVERKIPVTPSTLFELGSCSKAFTAMGVARLIDMEKIDMDDPLTKYIPWLRMYYKQKETTVTIAQVLHHTSGIPWRTIGELPQTNDTNALEQTVRKLEGITLNNKPGTKYEYATINYDVLALIIEKVSELRFEDYIRQYVMVPVGMTGSSVGMPKNHSLKAKGYKIGFLHPVLYNAPVFRGNNAAGYVITDAKDVLKWLKFQLGTLPSPHYHLAKMTQQRDETVPLHNMSSYAMGWNVSLNGNGEIYHGGLNPNFTSYIALRPKKGVGIAVLANSNSAYTEVIANRILKKYLGEVAETVEEIAPDGGYDKTFTWLTLVVLVYVIAGLVFLGFVLHEIRYKRRKYAGVRAIKFSAIARSVLLLTPFLPSIYWLPWVMTDMDWEAMVVWAPVSFVAFIGSLIAAVFFTYCLYFLTLIWPASDPVRRMIPGIMLMSILSGISNLLVIIMVTSALDNYRDTRIGYMVFYFLLVTGIYLLGRRFVQIGLIKLTTGLIYDLRIELIDKIFTTSYQKFEKIDKGRVYTAMNDDVNTIGGSANTFVTLVTSIVTALGAFLYLSAIAFWATVLTTFLIITVSVIYYVVSKSTNHYFEEARDSRNRFVRLLNGLVDGFRELNLHWFKKTEYKDDIAASAHEYKNKTSTADIRFVNAFIIGEALLVILLGVLTYGMPRMFPGISFYTVMSFVVVLLYLIGPINSILGAVPSIMRLKVGWKRIQQFLKEIPSDLDKTALHPLTIPMVYSFKATEISFEYKENSGQDIFRIGPLSLEANRGEVLFIIGGNGSGKSTLAKLLTGLYTPDIGQIYINNSPVPQAQLGEYFSIVFNPIYLFDKMYSVNTSGKKEKIEKYLRILGLEGKVALDGNCYTTIELSTGQRKRLALLQCYMEDAPICLFDEWAADQDPGYKHFFYRTILPEMKRAGKIVIAITHDDHYFDAADKIMKMEHGQLSILHINKARLNIINK